MDTSQQKFGIKAVIKGLKDIFRYTKDYKKELILIFILITISSAIEALGPYIWGKVIDSINNAEKITFYGVATSQVYVILSIYLVFLIIQSFIDLRKNLKARWVEESVRISYLSTSFLHIFRLPFGFHKSVKRGEINEKISSAGRAIESIFGTAIIQSIPELVTAGIMFIFVIATNFYIGLTVGLALVGFVYLSIKEIAPTVILQRQVRNAYTKASGIVQDAFNNIRSVKDFNTEKYEYEKIKQTYTEEAMTTWYKLVTIQRSTSAMQNYIKIGVRAVVLVVSIYLISKGEMTVGSMLAYNTYALMIFGPLSNVINNWKTIQNGIISFEDAELIIQKPTEIYEPPFLQQEIKGNISFKNVSFYYDKENPVLKDVSFDVHQGETIALVGESGVGKSTLVDLLSGYHFARKGIVMVDGMNINEVSLNNLRKNIAVVSQEISLFNDSIKNNIAYGSFDKTNEEIREAARKAHCSDFIEKFPEKWDQMVGEKGLKLSIGQKQRVAIARAILKDPKILILDEPTSALDAGSEKIITESFRELMKGRTTFIIAHRLSTVREADTILVFKNGEIVERGTHTELIEIQGGEYRRLYELQIGLHA